MSPNSTHDWPRVSATADRLPQVLMLPWRGIDCLTRLLGRLRAVENKFFKEAAGRSARGTCAGGPWRPTVQANPTGQRPWSRMPALSASLRHAYRPRPAPPDDAFALRE